MKSTPRRIVYVSTVPWQRVTPRVRQVFDALSKKRTLTYVYCPPISYFRFVRDAFRRWFSGNSNGASPVASFPRRMRYIRIHNLFPKRFERWSRFQDTMKCMLLRVLLRTGKKGCIVWFGHPSVYTYVNQLGDVASVFDTSDEFSQKSTLSFYEHQCIDYSFIPIFYDHRQGGKHRVKIVHFSQRKNVEDIYSRLFRAIEEL